MEFQLISTFLMYWGLWGFPCRTSIEVTNTAHSCCQSSLHRRKSKLRKLVGTGSLFFRHHNNLLLLCVSKGNTSVCSSFVSNSRASPAYLFSIFSVVLFRNQFHFKNSSSACRHSRDGRLWNGHLSSFGPSAKCQSLSLLPNNQKDRQRI